MRQYDYLIVGAGLSGAVFAEQVTKQGKRCYVVEKRPVVGGNIYDQWTKNILVHRYGAHVFHTNNTNVWNYVLQYSEMNSFVNSPIANYKGELYNLPFNMNTFYQLWGTVTPEQAEQKIAQERIAFTNKIENLEQQALHLVGTEIYEKLIKGYTEKQWGRPCTELPPFIIKRIPLRFCYDNNYFNDRYQGIPVRGYTAMIESMLEGSTVVCGVNYLEDRERYRELANKVVYTGMIDEYFDYRFGHLEYRSLRFEDNYFEVPNKQGVAVMNYTDKETPYTRTIEHKLFAFSDQPHTIVTREYPVEWQPGLEPYYPVNDEKNQELFQKYQQLASKESEVLFCGRLAKYCYYDMDKAIEAAWALASQELQNTKKGAML